MQIIWVSPLLPRLQKNGPVNGPETEKEDFKTDLLNYLSNYNLNVYLKLYKFLSVNERNWLATFI